MLVSLFFFLLFLLFLLFYLFSYYYYIFFFRFSKQDSTTSGLKLTHETIDVSGKWLWPQAVSLCGYLKRGLEVIHSKLFICQSF